MTEAEKIIDLTAAGETMRGITVTDLKKQFLAKS